MSEYLKMRQLCIAVLQCLLVTWGQALCHMDLEKQEQDR